MRSVRGNSSGGSVLIIYTGGTIGMKRDTVSGALVPVEFDELEREIPELSRFDVTTISFEEPIDSSNITPSIWRDLSHIIYENYSEYDGFVILHGTDTMSYTASALSYMLQGLDKPIILTGSQLPISEARTDGRENLLTALEIASFKDGERMMVREVCIFFSSHLYRGNRTTKQDAEMFTAFTSHNYPVLAKAGTGILFDKNALLRPSANATLRLQTDFCTEVVVITIFPGLTDKVLNAIFSVQGLKGVVLRSFGSGNIPTAPWMVDIIQRASDNGVVFLNVTQCTGGRVDMGQYDTSLSLVGAGVVSGEDMTVEAAVTKLMFLLGSCRSILEVRNLLNSSISGEVSLPL